MLVVFVVAVVVIAVLLQGAALSISTIAQGLGLAG
jgi:hypothetical protein